MGMTSTVTAQTETDTTESRFSVFNYLMSGEQEGVFEIDVETGFSLKGTITINPAIITRYFGPKMLQLGYGQN